MSLSTTHLSALHHC